MNKQWREAENDAARDSVQQPVADCSPDENAEAGESSARKPIPWLVTGSQLSEWTTLPAGAIMPFMRKRGVRVSVNAQAGEQVYRVDLLQFLAFWKSVDAGDGMLREQEIPFDSVDIDKEYYIHDERLEAPTPILMKSMRSEFLFEPTCLVRLANGRYKIFTGWIQFVAAWNAGESRISAYVIPDAAILVSWLNIERDAAGARAEEFPANFVSRVFDAFPVYENAVRSGRISCRQARGELGLKSHLPVFRALKKRLQRQMAFTGIAAGRGAQREPVVETVAVSSGV